MHSATLEPKVVSLKERQIYVIGDVHGCPAELELMLSHLKKQPDFTQDSFLIMLGDYINKGTQARAVVDLLIQLKKEHENCLFLRGNHEEMFLKYLGYESTSRDIFLRAGGRLTLESFGLDEGTEIAKVKEALQGEYLEFFLGLECMVISEEFIFVHAGLDPVLRVPDQRPRDLFWIREEFIEKTHRFGNTVLFGHTPFQDVMFDLPYKIGMDTGLVYDNMLSCIELRQGKIFQIRRNSRDVLERTVPVKWPSCPAGN